MMSRATGLAIGVALAVTGSAALGGDRNGDRFESGDKDRNFVRIATLPNYRNASSDSAETVSEIVAATKDGRTLVYTDSPGEAIGIVSIHLPAFPIPLGTVALGGEPTSVDILGNKYALVGVNTSADFVTPSGHVAVVNLMTRTIEAELDVGGQPDSVKISPNGRYAAVVIENERDEDITVDGVEGGLPQLPGGYLAIVDIVGGNPATWGVRKADLTGLATYATDDPEPEFVDVNSKNEAVVSFQENNHVAIVDLGSGAVIGGFPAGTVDLDEVDATEDGIILLSESLQGIPREPDAIAWIELKNGKEVIATANEGDLFGGSRGFSFFDRDGNVLFDSGNSYEHLAVRHGHYPEDRSENKGSEPESIEFGKFGGDRYVFVGSERGSFVAVYSLDEDRAEPTFRQLLPAPLGPEGLLAIPQRGLLVASGEADDPTFGVRSTMMIYELKRGKPAYPQILSANDADGLPIPWSALSGMDSVPGDSDKLLAVWDSYYSESRIFTIDTSEKPALITGSLTIVGGTGNYDPEGIAVAPDGTYWVASEGNASGSRPNRLLQVDRASGAVLAEVGLPAEIEACRAASTATGTLGSGFEGLAIYDASRDSDTYKLIVAQQRGWDYTTPDCEDLDDDQLGLNARGEPLASRLWIYDPTTGDWGHISWELAPLPTNASWVGLSEVTASPRGSFTVIERDNRTGDWAELKTLVNVSRRDLADGEITASEKAIYDLLPAMFATRGWISDKPEGVAVTEDGDVFVVTDNDGVEDWSGETSFLRLGRFNRLFRR